jgi:hypothetical protein
MGYNRSYDQEQYRSRTLRSLNDGTLHKFSDDQLSKPREQRKMYEFLDPKRKNKKGDNEGTIIRESLDLPGEDNTTPIVIVFDSTSSMRTSRPCSSRASASSWPIWRRPRSRTRRS